MASGVNIFPNRLTYSSCFSRILWYQLGELLEVHWCSWISNNLFPSDTAAAELFRRSSNARHLLPVVFSPQQWPQFLLLPILPHHRLCQLRVWKEASRRSCGKNSVLSTGWNFKIIISFFCRTPITPDHSQNQHQMALNPIPICLPLILR